MNSTADLFIVYQILKRLVAPFEEWDAFASGVIDAEGNVVVKKSDRTSAQKDSFQKLDLMILRIKNLLGKLPGGKTKIASFAAALWLVKESDAVEYGEMLLDEEIERKLNHYMTITENHSDVNSRFELFEELTTMSVAPPAGINDHSLRMGNKLKDKLARRKKAIAEGERPQRTSMDPPKQKSPSNGSGLSSSSNLGRGHSTENGSSLGRGHDSDGSSSVSAYKPKKALSKNPAAKVQKTINKTTTTTSNTAPAST